MFVALLTSVIDAPSITLPVASVMVPVIAPWSTWANAACAARQNRATITSLVNAFKNESFGNLFLMASIPLQILLAISAPDVLQFSRNNVVIRGLCDIVRNIELLFGRDRSPHHREMPIQKSPTGDASSIAFRTLSIQKFHHGECSFNR